MCLGLGAVAFLVVAAPIHLIRDRVVEVMRERAGRELVVAGGTSVSLFPKVTVALGDVSVAAPQDMPGEPTLSVGALEVEVGYWSLLTGRPKAHRVVLHRPVIELAIDGEGRRSWDFAVSKQPRAGADEAPQAKEDPGSGPVAAKAPRVPDFGEVRIVDGTVRYRNARSGAQYELTGLALNAFGDGASGPLRIEGSAAWRGERVAFSGTASPGSALAVGRPAQLALTLRAAALEASYEGSLVVAGGAQLEGKVSLKSPSLRALRAWLSKAPPPGEGEADPVAATALVTARGRARLGVQPRPDGRIIKRPGHLRRGGERRPPAREREAHGDGSRYGQPSGSAGKGSARRNTAGASAGCAPAAGFGSA